MTVRRATGAAALVALLVLQPGCRGCGGRRGDAPRSGEAAVALALFNLAQRGELGRQQLAQVVQEDLLGSGSVELLDSLERLGNPLDLEVIRVLRMPDLNRAAVDVRAGLPGEGSAVYTIQAAEQADGTWRVVWFQGPGVVWPRDRGRVDQGLSTSPIPE